MSLVHDGVSVVMPQQAFHLEDFLNRAPVVDLEGWPFLSASVSAEAFIKSGGGSSDVASNEPICPVKFAENVCSNAGPHHVLRDVVFVQYVRIHNLPSPDVLNPPHDGLRTVSSAPPFVLGRLSICRPQNEISNITKHEEFNKNTFSPCLRV